MEDKDPYCIIGVIDGYGAIHHEPLYPGDHRTHEDIWPMTTHKRWRFNLSDWKLDQSVFSSESLGTAEKEMIYDCMRKHYTPPLWFLEGEEWEALGRPRSGKKYEEHTKKWDKIYGRQII